MDTYDDREEEVITLYRPWIRVLGNDDDATPYGPMDGGWRNERSIGSHFDGRVMRWDRVVGVIEKDVS